MKKSLAYLFFALGLPLLLFATVEGLLNFFLVGRAVVNFSLPQFAERTHTKYDPLLGWVNIPNFHAEDLYGPGIYLRTNSLGFRNDKEPGAMAPMQTTRLICSGDSFTLGYGVKNSDTWCSKLEELNPHLEALNMGQGGYGIDQAYLWYKRDGVKLAPKVHLFAFIDEDLSRMANDKFVGYDKPQFRLKNGTLELHNVPVPSGTHSKYPIARFTILKNLLIFRSINHFISPGNYSDRAVNTNVELFSIFEKIATDLRALNEREAIRTVFVRLPGKENFRAPNSVQSRISAIAKKNHLEFWDLNEELDLLSTIELDSLYIKPGQVDYPGATGHFTTEGNGFAANAIYRRLCKDGSCH